MTCYYFALGRGANIAISVPVCLCVYLCLYICTSISPFAYLKNHMYKNKEMFCCVHVSCDPGSVLI